VAEATTLPATGGPEELNVTVSVSVFELLAASRAVTVMALLPGCNGTDADHEVVPDAVPLPPVAAFDQVTEVTPTLSEAVPPIARGDEVVV
jgi:hypothetical protein